MTGPVNTLSTLHTNILSRRRVADLQTTLSRAGEEATTGYKSDVFRELGRGAAQSISLRRERERTDAFLTSNQQLSGRLDTMASALSSARESVQEVFDLVAPSIDSPGATAGELQSAARSALDALASRLNSSYGGVQLFSGVEAQTVPLRPWDGDDTGATAPRDLVAAVLGGGIGDLLDANDKIGQMNAIFAPGGDYDGTIYVGAPETSAARPQARIDESVTLDFGVQASDRAFAKVYQGLAMLAGTDVSEIGDGEAYSAYMKSVSNALSGGLDGILTAESDLGRAQQRLARTMTAQEDRSELLGSRVLDLEGVDSYEAATRVSQLQSQLEATYAITSKLSRMSFLNYMS